MEIGKEDDAIIVEPLEDPFKKPEPSAPEKPVEQPAEPEKVPA